MLDRTGFEQRNGRLFLVISAICYSTAGLFVQLIDVSVPTMLCIRGFVAAAFIFGLMLLWDGQAAAAKFNVLRSLPGLVAVAASVAAMYFNLTAYRMTPVANVVVIYSAAPFVAAGLARLVFGEKVPATTLGAAALAALGTIILMSGSLGNGNFAGDLMALCMTFSMALMIVAIRWGKAKSMVAIAGTSALVSAFFFLPAAEFSTLHWNDLWLLVIFGITQLGLGILFLTLGARHVNATQSALIGTLDVPLAPLWVWFAFGAVPPSLTFVGGAIMMFAVISSIVMEHRSGLRIEESST